MKPNNLTTTWTYGLELLRRRAVVVPGQRSVFFCHMEVQLPDQPSIPSEVPPIQFGPSQRISITASHFTGNGHVCLFYNQEEFEDVVSRRCSDPTSKFELDPAARAYLYGITNGHPGATDALLNFIFMVCMSCSIYTRV